jgi:CRISPR/Cas system CMR-associated protein Cmr5 small subunit
LRVVFIGYSSANLTEKVKDVKKYASDHDWLNKESNVFIEEHIKNMIAYAKNIKKECQKVGVTYLDVSKNFEASIEEVLSYLKND